MPKEMMYFTSIQGSGTQFFGNILSQHPYLVIVPMGGPYPVFSLVSLLRQNVIYENMLDPLVIYCGMVQGKADLWHTASGKSDRLRMFEMYRKSSVTIEKHNRNSPYEKTFLFSHLFPMVSGVRFHTITDLAIDLQINRRAIVPLRDPIRAIFSLMKRGSFSQHIRNREISYAIRGFEMLKKFSERCDTFFFPVDLCETDEGLRKDFVASMFDFIGLPLTDAVSKVVNDYERINTGRLHKLPLEMEILKEAFKASPYVTGVNAEMDFNIDTLRKIEGLAEIYQSVGYTDLEWF